MSPPPPPRFDLRWTTKNVVALLAVCVVGLVLLAVRYTTRPLAVSEQVPVDPARSQAATERLNPNTASAVSLQRLPGIGPAKAQAILDYRRAHGERAFRSPSDLAAIKGFGPNTVEHLTPFLVFPTTAPATGTARGK
jgi:competence ComEA-like helix-hairpin-helix protein